MPKQKVKCHICESINKGDILPEFCIMCSTNLLDPSHETRQKNHNSSEHKDWLGPLILTSRRLIFVMQVRVGNAHESFGTGALNMIASGVKDVATAIGDYKAFDTKEHHLGMSLLPGTIQSVEIVKGGFLEHLVVITTKDGAEHKLQVPKKRTEEWKEAILQFNSQ